MRLRSRSARIAGLISVGAVMAITACVEETPATPPLESLTIIAPALSVEYGEAIPMITPTYQPYAVAVSGLTCTTTATATSDVGVYPIECSGASFGATAISYIAGTVTITPAPLTITASSGSLIPSDDPLTITPSYVGLKVGDGAPATPPTCSTDATPSSALGQYSSVCSGAADANYDISYVNGSVQVAAGRLTVTASSASVVQGDALPTALPSYSGWLDGSSSIQQPATCRPLTTANPPAGQWPIRCSGAADDTYVFDYVDGTLDVKASGYIALMPSSRTTEIAAASNAVSLPTGTINVTYGTQRGFGNMSALTIQTSAGLQVVFCDTVSETAFYGCTGGTGTLSTGAPVTSAAPTDFKVSTVTGPINAASVTVLADAPASHRLVPTTVMNQGGEAYVRFLQSAYPPGATWLTVGYCTTSATYSAGAADCDTLRINVLIATPLAFGAAVPTPIGAINQYQAVWVGVASSGSSRTGDVVGLHIVPAAQLTPARQTAPVVNTATVVSIRDFMNTVPVPAGTDFVSAKVKGGDARVTADTRLALCTAAGVNCWAQTGWPYNQTTLPYVQSGIGTTSVPGGVAVTLPAIELAFKVTASTGTTIRTGVSQFLTSITANAGFLGDQNVTFWAYPTTGGNTESAPPSVAVYPLLNNIVVP